MWRPGGLPNKWVREESAGREGLMGDAKALADIPPHDLCADAIPACPSAALI